MNNRLPEKLYAKQEQTRQETINKVLHALSELQAQGCRLSIKNLMEYTGLSRSVFAKSHVRAVLSEYVAAFTRPEVSTANEETPANQTKEQKLRSEIRKKDTQIKRLREEKAALNEECELLRGRLFLLMQRQNLE
jgi:hypothetical protein